MWRAILLLEHLNASVVTLSNVVGEKCIHQQIKYHLEYLTAIDDPAGELTSGQWHINACCYFLLSVQRNAIAIL